MKTFILALSFVAISSANASTQDLVDCQAVEVIDSSYLEESLSVEEYPEVQLTQDETGLKEAWLGSSLYSEDDGDTITLENAAGFDKIYTINPSHQLEQYQIVVNGNPMYREGHLLARRREAVNEKYGEWGLIALLKCE